MLPFRQSKFLFVTCLISLSLFGEDPPTGRFHRLSAEKDLASTIVNVVFQDRHGYIWIGGDNGLDRYDGHNLLHFSHDPADPDSLGGDHVTDIAEDREGLLWVTTRGGGTSLLDWQTGKAIRFDVGSSRLEKVTMSLRDQVWLASEDKGLFRYDQKELQSPWQRWSHDPADATSLSANRVLGFVNETNRAWVATERGLDLLDTNTNKTERLVGTEAFPLRNIPIRVLDLKDGLLWIGTARGLATLDPETGELEVLLTGRAPTVLLFQDDRAWVGTAGSGLGLLLDGVWTFYRHNPKSSFSLAADEIQTLSLDRSGNLWVGTRGAGVSIMDVKPVLFRSYEPERNRPETDIFRGVSAIAGGPDNSLWIGSERNGLGLFDRDERAVRRFQPEPGNPRSLSSSRVQCLLIDRRGVLWVGTFVGLNRYDGEGEGFTRFSRQESAVGSLSHNSVHALMETGDGVLWIGTENGVTHFRNGRLVPVGDPAQLGHVNTIFEDSRGDVWFATDGPKTVMRLSAMHRMRPSSCATSRFTTSQKKTGCGSGPMGAV